MVGSAFLWIVSISVLAILWAMLGPLQTYTLLLVLLSTVVQEASRWGSYILYMRLLRGLQAAGLQPVPAAGRKPCTVAAIMPAAIANGLGIGVANALVLQGDVLSRALLPGTLYTEACTHLSVFSVAALSSSAMLMINVMLSVICTHRPSRPRARPPCTLPPLPWPSAHHLLHSRTRPIESTSLAWQVVGWVAAYPQSPRRLVACICALHAMASGATAFNSPTLVPTGGCAVALPMLFCVLLATGFFTCWVSTARLQASSKG